MIYKELQNPMYILYKLKGKIVCRDDRLELVEGAILIEEDLKEIDYLVKEFGFSYKNNLTTN